jgi:hypothetical protein
MVTAVDAPATEEPSGAAHFLDGVLNPKGVAAVGVTVTSQMIPGDIGILPNVLVSGYRGRVDLIVPRERRICGDGTWLRDIQPPQIPPASGVSQPPTLGIGQADGPSAQMMNHQTRSPCRTTQRSGRADPWR